MIYKLRIFLWHVVAELEYILYPWKDGNSPSVETISKYNLPEESFDEKLNYDWLKSHDEKINKLEQNIIELFDRINKLNK